MWNNVLYATRVLRKSPTFTATVLLTLALGIGANAAIFSVVSAVLVRPLPIRDPKRVVVLHDQFPTLNLPRTTVSVLQFRDFSERTDLFHSTAALKPANLTLTGHGQALRLQAMEATSGFFPLLGIRPEFGRDFMAQDDIYGSQHAVLLSHGLWRRLFGDDRGVIGRDLHLDADSYEIIGVLPEKIQALYPKVEIWVPAVFDPESLSPKYRWYVGYSMLARLAPGVSLRQAQAGMDTSAANFNGGTFAQFHVEVRSLIEEEVGDTRFSLYLLLGAVGLLLLIACANVANLVMVRNEGRAQEIAIRNSLGCGRMRIISQLLTESVLLAVSGGVLGLLLAGALLRALIGLAPGDVPRMGDIHLDGSVLIWTFATCLIACALFGVLPAFLSARPQPAEALKLGGRGAAVGNRSFGNALAVSQVALALVLLVGSGLLLRSFKRLLEVNPGFVPDNVLTMRFSQPLDAINPQSSSLPPYDPARVASFATSLLDRVSVLSGVSRAAIATGLPFASDGYKGTFGVKGRNGDENKPTPYANFMYVTPQYFNTMKIPLIAGRFYTPAEMRDGNDLRNGAVRIIDETLAKRFWPNENPIGSEIGNKSDGWATVIGVVGAVHDTDLAAESKGTIYVPGYAGTTLVIRTKSNPAAFVAAVSEAIGQTDRSVAVYDVNTMQDLLVASLQRRKFAAMLLTVFAGLALALASVGLYAVLSYLVTRRTHEIGIRIAIGASRENVLLLIFRYGLTMSLSGVALGLGASLLLKPLIASQLFGVQPLDALTMSLASLMLVMTAMLASFVPANRATRVDPMVALRHE
ncbi:MAG TPA: ABC transporter permease [Candidatus Acidoferrum sp.]|nr:ABC transporter permease [Candidatus Acidoferrum sp.]